MLTILWKDAPEIPTQRALLKRVFMVACAATNTPASVEVTVLLTDDARLQVLNRTYRHQNTPTDVLSFPQRDTSLENAGFKPALPADGGECLGDIAISMPRVQAQAAAYGHSEERELAYLFVHGFLLSAPHWARSFRRNRPHEDARARRSHSHRSRPATLFQLTS